MAIVRYQPPRIKTSGNEDGKVSTKLKAILQQGNTRVCGVIAEGTTIDLQANWNSPYDNITGNSLDIINDGLQIAAERTLKNSASTIQVWQGNEALSISLALAFYALNDAQKEVEDAIIELRRFISPELGSILPLGQPPGLVMLNLRGRTTFPKCVLKSVAENHSDVVDAAGNRLSTTVTLSIETERVMNKSQF